jgi:hypothetical protein
MVIGEIQEDAGVRYSPVAAAALEDETVVEEIKRILEVEREEAYYTAYLHACNPEGNAND